MSQTKPKSPLPANKTSPPAAVNAQLADVLTLAEAAAYLRTSPEEVRRLVREQGLPARRVGKDCRLLKAAIQDWLRGSPSPATKEDFWQSHFGALKEDPALEEMLAEIYRRRGRPEVGD